MNTLGRNALAAALLMLGGSAAMAAPAKNPEIQMQVARRGTVLIELYPSEAPKTVAHILSLARSGFYNGILIHRVEPGFVVQAGDPQTKTMGIDAPGIGSGGSGKNIPFEANKLTHEPGTIAMALSGPRSDTGDSQWFINLVPNHRLDGDYCVFGKVIKGFDVVQKIRRGDKIISMTVVGESSRRQSRHPAHTHHSAH